MPDYGDGTPYFIRTGVASPEAGRVSTNRSSKASSSRSPTAVGAPKPFRIGPTVLLCPRVLRRAASYSEDEGVAGSFGHRRPDVEVLLDDPWDVALFSVGLLRRSLHGPVQKLLRALQPLDYLGARRKAVSDSLTPN